MRSKFFIFAYLFFILIVNCGSELYRPSKISVPLGFRPAVMAIDPDLHLIEYSSLSDSRILSSGVIAVFDSAPQGYEIKSNWLSDKLFLLVRTDLGNIEDSPPKINSIADAMTYLKSIQQNEIENKIAVSDAVFSRIEECKGALSPLIDEYRLIEFDDPILALEKEESAAAIISGSERAALAIRKGDIVERSVIINIEGSERTLKLCVRKDDNSALLTSKLLIEKKYKAEKAGYEPAE